MLNKKILSIVTTVFLILLNRSQSNIILKNGEVVGISPPSDTPLKNYNNAGISCDAEYCADIANEILKEGGSVGDAGIGGMLCMGAIHPHSLGIGGGFLLVIYNATTGEYRSLNARETAPAGAHENMFEEYPENSTIGGLAVGIPGEIKGYMELHKAYGRLPWKRLIQPTIDLCLNGINVTKSAADAMISKEKEIRNEPSLSEIFINPSTGKLWKEGEIMSRKVLGKTLQIIGEKGGDELYFGKLGDDLISDLNLFGSIITKDDLMNYNVSWSDGINIEIEDGKYRIITVPPPGSGILLSFILRVLINYLPKPTTIQEYTTAYQRIIETFKYTYAKRLILGDPFDEEISSDVENLIQLLKSNKFRDEIRSLLMDNSTNNTGEYYGAEFGNLPNDHGTAHISIIGENGDALSMTSTINTFFGAKIRSISTGIILNNEMDDFSSPNTTNSFGLPPSPNNYIKPGKRPMSSMCPSIFIDMDGRVRFVVGASGGTRITTSTALVSIYNLWFGMNVKESLDERRIHHQLLPMHIEYDSDFSKVILNNLKSYGHNITIGEGGVVAAVERISNGTIQSSFDFRKSGSIAGY